MRTTNKQHTVQTKRPKQKDEFRKINKLLIKKKGKNEMKRKDF